MKSKQFFNGLEYEAETLNVTWRHFKYSRKINDEINEHIYYMDGRITCHRLHYVPDNPSNMFEMMGVYSGIGITYNYGL